MHYVPFKFKRAHYASLKMMWPIAARFGLTPARFDLLYAAHVLRRDRYEANIARMLGVSRTTTWRMAHSLEEAGVVTLEADRDDSRRRRVVLTTWGKKLFHALLKVVFRQRKVEHEIRKAVRPTLRPPPRCRWDELLALDRIILETWRVPFGLGDGGTLRYPRETQDLDRR